MNYRTFDSNTGKLIQVYDLEECLNAIRIRNNDNEQKIKYLKEENQKLKEENFKEKEIQKMQQTLKMLQKEYYRGFPITEEEQNAIEAWKKEHTANVHGLKTAEERMEAQGTIGGGWCYEFIPTSIGVIGKIKCSHCGEEFIFQEIN